MNTFLPYASFERSARCLDMRRLGKQRVEAWQILNALRRGSGGWINHPAVKMWRDTPHALALYGYECCQAWIDRGYRDSLRPKFADYLAGTIIRMPQWLGVPILHAGYRASLMRKDPRWYGQFGWGVKPDRLYWWPVR